FGFGPSAGSTRTFSVILRPDFVCRFSQTRYWPQRASTSLPSRHALQGWSLVREEWAGSAAQDGRDTKDAKARTERRKRSRGMNYYSYSWFPPIRKPEAEVSRCQGKPIGDSGTV